MQYHTTFNASKSSVLELNNDLPKTQRMERSIIEASSYDAIDRRKVPDERLGVKLTGCVGKVEETKMAVLL